MFSFLPRVVVRPFGVRCEKAVAPRRPQDVERSEHSECRHRHRRRRRRPVESHPALFLGCQCCFLLVLVPVVVPVLVLFPRRRLGQCFPSWWEANRGCLRLVHLAPHPVRPPLLEVRSACHPSRLRTSLYSKIAASPFALMYLMRNRRMETEFSLV